MGKNAIARRPPSAGSLRRYLRRARLHAYSQTRRFFQSATSDKPVAAAIVIIYVATITITYTQSGASTAATLGRMFEQAVVSAVPLIVLMIGIFLWEAVRAPLTIHERQSLAAQRARRRLAETLAAQVAAQKLILNYPGGVEDVCVRWGLGNIGGGVPFREQRYALATDVEIINRHPTEPVSLTAELLIKYGLITLATPAESLNIDYWQRMLTAFHITARPQLLFPLNIQPRSSVAGHIAFRIDRNGKGHGIGGDDPGGRHYELEFHDNLSDVVQKAEVAVVTAPVLNTPQRAIPTDLAYPGPPSDPLLLT